MQRYNVIWNHKKLEDKKMCNTKFNARIIIKKLKNYITNKQQQKYKKIKNLFSKIYDFYLTNLIF